MYIIRITYTYTHIVYIVLSVYTYMRLRTDGVNTNGAAAKVMSFDRLGRKKVCPGTFGKIKVA